MTTGSTPATRTSLLLPVRSFDPLTPRARLLILDARGTRFDFRAGQAVWLGRDGASQAKPYSIASAPEDLARDGALEFLVGLEHDGEPGPHFAGIQRGDRIAMEGPIGGLALSPVQPRDDLLLVAGGTGIAPLRSLLHSVLARRAAEADRGRVDLVYSARRGPELAFMNEFVDLARAGRLGLTLTVTGPDPEWAGHRGRITRTALASHVPSMERTRCAICGPPTFVRYVLQLLQALGLEPSRIATESW